MSDGPPRRARRPSIPSSLPSLSAPSLPNLLGSARPPAAAAVTERARAVRGRGAKRGSREPRPRARTSGEVVSFAGATGGRSRTPTGGPAAAVVTRQRTVKVATVDSSALFDSSVEAEAEELEGGRYAPVDFVDAELSLELRREAVEAAAAATRLVKKEEEDGEEKEERLGQRLQAVELGCEASDPVNVFSKEKREKEMVFFQFPTVLPTTVGQEGKKEEDGCSEIEDRRGLLEKLPSGQIGTMRRWKSGKVTMRIGEVEFLVSGGTPYPFEQQVVALEYDKGNTPAESSGSLKFLGSLKHRFVCSVDVNSL